MLEACILTKNGAKLLKAKHKQATMTAHNLKATIEALKAEGTTAVREIASALNTRSIAPLKASNGTAHQVTAF